MWGARAVSTSGPAGRRRGSLLAPVKTWAILLSLCLVALAVGVEYFVFDRLLGRSGSTLATGLLLILGVAGFSWAVWRLLERVEGHLRASYAAERAQRRQLEALAAATADLSTGVDMEAVAQRIVERSREVTGTRYGALAVLGAEGRIGAFYTSGIDPETRAHLGAPPEGHGLLGLVTAEGRALRLDDLSSHPASAGFPPHHPRMRSLLAVPVRVQGQVIGSLYLCDREDGQPFSEADEEALRRFAAQAAVAIQNARLHERLRQLSILAERERIAMDLHDGVIQSLFGVRLQLEAALPGIVPASPEHASVEQVVDRLGVVMADIRHYIFDLRAELAEDVGIEGLLRQLIDSLRAGPVFGTELRVEGAPRRVRRPVQWELCHIAREALTNAVRHSGGGHLVVSLDYRSGALVLGVADDGAGWDGRPRGAGHHGLQNMRRRAETAGGTLEIETGPGRGTHVRAAVPARYAYAQGEGARPEPSEPPADPRGAPTGGGEEIAGDGGGGGGTGAGVGAGR